MQDYTFHYIYSSFSSYHSQIQIYLSDIDGLTLIHNGRIFWLICKETHSLIVEKVEQEAFGKGLYSNIDFDLHWYDSHLNFSAQ